VKSKSIRKEKWSFVGVQIPLYVCGYLFNPLYVILRAMFLRPLGRCLDRKDSHKLTSDIQQSLGFLFTRYHAIIVANGVRRLPPNFGPTIVTISVENIMIRVLRGRGELNIEVAPAFAHSDWHDLSLILAAIQDVPNLERRKFRDLWEVARELEPNLNSLIGHFDYQRFNVLKKRLELEVYAPESFARRQWESETNTRLYGRP
jgi:hypothetical protein